MNMRRFPQPDPDTVEIIDLYCHGCGRKLGVSYEEKPKRSRSIHCSELCWHKEQLSSLENAARDRFIQVMDKRGLSHNQIAAVFGIHRTRVPQILGIDARSRRVSGDEDYLQANRR